MTMTPINKDELFKLFFNRLCRHFVVMTGTYFQLDDSGKFISDELLFAYSGFAMSFGSAWFLVTAGHVKRPAATTTTEYSASSGAGGIVPPIHPIAE
ncbi:MAG: hypothetical protein ACLP9L_00585 [Thermoguttaceae bacterium]